MADTRKIIPQVLEGGVNEYVISVDNGGTTDDLPTDCPIGSTATSTDGKVYMYDKNGWKAWN